MSLIKKQSSTDLIIEYIIDKIEKKELKPGDRLMNERTFSEELGVSRIPLREAISALAILGILEARPGSGTYVGHYDPESLGRFMNIYSVLNGVSVDELFETRIIIEKEAVRLAIERATDEDIESIRACIQEAKEYLQDVQATEESVNHTFMLMNKFHKTIAAGTYNRYLQQFMDALRVISFQFILTNAKQIFSDSAIVLEGHTRIYEAIKARDVELAVKLIEDHLSAEVRVIKNEL